MAGKGHGLLCTFLIPLTTDRLNKVVPVDPFFPAAKKSRTIFPAPMVMLDHISQGNLIGIHQLFRDLRCMINGLFKIPIIVYAYFNMNRVRIARSTSAISCCPGCLLKRNGLNRFMVVYLEVPGG